MANEWISSSEAMERLTATMDENTAKERVVSFVQDPRFGFGADVVWEEADIGRICPDGDAMLATRYLRHFSGQTPKSYCRGSFKEGSPLDIEASFVSVAEGWSFDDKLSQLETGLFVATRPCRFKRHYLKTSMTEKGLWVTPPLHIEGKFVRRVVTNLLFPRDQFQEFNQRLKDKIEGILKPCAFSIPNTIKPSSSRFDYRMADSDLCDILEKGTNIAKFGVIGVRGTKKAMAEFIQERATDDGGNHPTLRAARYHLEILLDALTRRSPRQ